MYYLLIDKQCFKKIWCKDVRHVYMVLISVF